MVHVSVDDSCCSAQDLAKCCNNEFSEVVARIIEQNSFEVVHGKHSELFKVVGANVPTQIERFAAPLFRIVSRGADLTAYTMTKDGMKIWVPRPSSHMKTYPGMLDTTIAGGVRAEESPYETILHEADEEASLPKDLLVRDVKSCGVMTYMSLTSTDDGGEHGLLVPDTVYIYDIELKEDVIPRPQDDEVEEFYLMTVQEVTDALQRARFKANCAVVMIDFFIRHGIITEANESESVNLSMRISPIATGNGSCLTIISNSCNKFKSSKHRPTNVYAV